ncbi:hypothetical protein IFM89_006628 [Coptis chinensis]|uniref:Uncharacterized protein n=1 Tax=Coptis chinensis TaxID=261450 RepID=A0A835HJA8_9MAGN|nr:hypothetical protein IFM89_006628 [Coptis chinensis]
MHRKFHRTAGGYMVSPKKGYSGSLERVATKRVRSFENLLDGYNSSPTFDVHRDECLKELEVPLLMENDKNVEKAEVYTKELEDVSCFETATQTQAVRNVEVTSLRLEAVAARDEATTSLEQLHESECEIKALRTVSQRMILTKEEMLLLRSPPEAYKKWSRQEYWERFVQSRISDEFQILMAEFTCPPWLSFNAMKLLSRILDPSPITVTRIMEVETGSPYDLFGAE